MRAPAALHIALLTLLALSSTGLSQQVTVSIKPTSYLIPTEFGEQEPSAEEYTLYSDAQIALIATPGTPLPSPETLCGALSSHNPSLGRPRCLVGGEYLRSPAFAAYGAWLGINQLPGASRSDLASRDPAVDSLLAAARDDYLLLVHRRGDTTVTALFHDGKDHPLALLLQKGEFAPGAVAQEFFTGTATPIPTAAEREAARIEPDAYYRDQVPFDRFFGLGVGRIEGIGPAGEVVRYNENRDTGSAWNWIEGSQPSLLVEAGIGYARFASLSAFLQLSNHPVLAPLDSNPGLRSWELKRWEFGVRARLGHTYLPAIGWELFPYAGAAFHYTIYSGSPQLAPGTPTPARTFYLATVSGATGSVGLQLLWHDRWGLRSEAGISHRARRQQEAPPTETEIIDRPGEATSEWQANLTIFRNFRKLL
jgi:hypothetical protein